MGFIFRGRTMGDKIVHEGIIEKIGNGCIKVRIMQTSACASCKVSGHCHVSESKEKNIDIYDVKDIHHFSIGESVLVTTSLHTGANAVIVAFVIPFVILVTTVFFSSAFTDQEPLMAMTGICSMIPYYTILYVMRNRLGQKFSFNIEKKQLNY